MKSILMDKLITMVNNFDILSEGDKEEQQLIKKEKCNNEDNNILMKVFCRIFSQLQKEEFAVCKKKCENIEENNNIRVETNYIALEEYITLMTLETINIELLFEEKKNNLISKVQT